MDFNSEELLKLAEEASQFEEIKLSDIPSINLYMDQVTTLFEDKLSHLKRNADETILTKTMINNYAKAKILTPVKNKKYNRAQIMTLILIYNLKQILSLEDIKALFGPILNKMTQDPANSFLIEDLYSNFLDIKEKQSADFINDTHKDIEFIDGQYQEEKDNSRLSQLMLTVLTLINSSNMQKRLAEKLIDTYFKEKEQ